jgi:hypothetical protein
LLRPRLDRLGADQVAATASSSLQLTTVDRRPDRALAAAQLDGERRHREDRRRMIMLVVTMIIVDQLAQPFERRRRGGDRLNEVESEVAHRTPRRSTVSRAVRRRLVTASS